MSPVRVLFGKELKETLRDRRTLAMMVLVPMLLYPLLMLALGGLMLVSKKRLSELELQIARVDVEAEALLPPTLAPPRTTFVRMSREEAEAALREKEIGAFVTARQGARKALEEGGQAALTLHYTQRHDTSLEALRRVEEVLRHLAEKTVSERLESRALPKAFATPVDAEAVDVDFAEDLGPLLVSRLLPLLLTVMLFLGAFYAAIDVTAGEKERGTLETLLVAPVRPLQVMLAKYLAVSTLCVAVALANVLSMGLTFGVGISMAEDVRIGVVLGPAQLGLLGLALVPAAFLVSGISLAVASLARSFKEGQDLLTPLIVLGLVPGIAAVLPGAELTPVRALIPLYNVALLIKAVVLGGVGGWEVLLVVGSTALLALGALWLAANAFRSERLRFGGGAGSWRALFRG